MTNVNPINHVPFGQEKTREEFLARATWEYDQASRIRALPKKPIGYMAIIEGHERAAKAYEREAQNQPSASAHSDHRRAHATIATPVKGKRGASTKRLVYVVQGNYGYGHGWEDLTSEEDGKEARERLREYRENELGIPFRVIKRREKINSPVGSAHARRKKLDAGRDNDAALTRQVIRALRLYEDRGEFNPRGRAKAQGAPATPLAQARDVLTRAGYDWRSAGPIARRYIQEHAAPRSHARVTKLPSSERAHARKRKLSPREAKQRLKAEGIDFGSDFHELRSSDVDKILAVAKETGYRKRKDAPGSTARMYFQYLQRQPCQ